MQHVPFDVLGNIAIVKFRKGTKASNKKKFADKLLKENKSIRTVLEKSGKFSGRLRKQETKFIAGEKTKEAIYKENGCVFRFNVDSTYFSPRLSNERKQIAAKVKKGESVLVMFAGIAPYPIVIAKNSKARKIYSNEINREANKYAELNIELNKLKGKVCLLEGNIKLIAEKISRGFIIKNKRASGSERVPKVFDVIIMPRPQLKDSFLKEAFALSRKGTRIFYYDFCEEDEIQDIVQKVVSRATESKRKIKISGVKRAGEIGARRYRIRIDFTVLN